jgi:hypothetical protein
MKGRYNKPLGIQNSIKSRQMRALQSQPTVPRPYSITESRPPAPKQ